MPLPVFSFHTMNRRSFLATSLATLGASTLPAIEPIKRAGKPRFQLGLAAYSFREYFPYMKDKEVKPKEGHDPMDMVKFIQYCAEHGCDGAELTSYFFPIKADDAYFLEIRRQAYLSGVALSGTAIGNTWALPKGAEMEEQIAYTKQWIDRAELMGAPHIRVFAGVAKKELSQEEATKNCIETYGQCAEYAAKKGVFLGMENHHGIVADPDNLVHIIKSVNSPWVGINFDSGNFNTPDPYGDLAKIAPYAINVQLKMVMKPKDKAPEPTDIPRVIKILKDANYQGWFTLEYEDKEDPFTAVPRILKELKPLLAS
ncbi:MAG: hypothetical protein RL693_2651 [Verrucomicrobiota bacterium]